MNTTLPVWDSFDLSTERFRQLKQAEHLRLFNTLMAIQSRRNPELLNSCPGTREKSEECWNLACKILDSYQLLAKTEAVENSLQHHNPQHYVGD